jgi:hypothetical protein
MPEKKQLFQRPPQRPGPRLPLPEPDPQVPPTLSERIVEALANLTGVPSEIDLMGPYDPAKDATPRAQGLRSAAAAGSMAGMLNPAMVSRILAALKFPSRLAKSAKVFEEIKAVHPRGVAHLSNISEATNPKVLASIRPVSADAGPFQAPDAPVFDMDFPVGDKWVRQPGRLTLEVQEQLEDLDPARAYGVLRHELNHAAQARLRRGTLLPDYHRENAAQGYMENPIEVLSRVAGYKGAIRKRPDLTANALRLTPEQLTIMRLFGHEQNVLNSFADTDPARWEEMVKEMLEFARELRSMQGKKSKF